VQGIVCDDDADLTLLFDSPRGFAYGALTSAERPDRFLVAVSGSASAEYLADLWALLPAALLLRDMLDRDLSTAIEHTVRGERYRNVDWITPLTVSERRTLRYIAYGWDYKRVAECLCVSPQSVSNTVSRLLDKLGLDNRNRNAATLYYWGIAQDFLREDGEECEECEGK
jgi:DNA-binding NarL/FixJ family response regulator